MPTGIYQRTEKHRKAISESSKRYPRTEKHNNAISEALKRYFSENGMSGEWRKHISERPITDTWRKNCSRAQKGRKLSLLHRQKIGISIMGRTVSKATRAKIASSLNGHPVSKETRGKISATERELFRNGKRLPNNHAQSSGWFLTDKGIAVRSSWELFISSLLTKFNIEWQYEPKVFDLGFATYRPDFYLPEYEVWIEVKGYWWDGEKEKVDAFSALHPLLLIDEKAYQEIVDDNTVLVRWLVSMR